MSATAELIEDRVITAPPRRRRSTAARRRGVPSILTPWLKAQSINVTRHAAALRPFRRDEFGITAAAPTEGHIQAVNQLIETLRAELLGAAERVTGATRTAIGLPSTRNLQTLLRLKEYAHNWVRSVERIWDFYFELFGQRQSQFGDWLLSCDRIALDCYQASFLGVGVAKPLPAPPPFAYMRTGFSPATFRRGIPLRRLGRQLNPFPLVQLPYHRLVNPWTLGAILHEVSHNLQNDLGVDRAVPRRIGQRLLREGKGRAVAAVWTRWNRETFADLSGLLLGGPAVVASLMDIIGRSPATVTSYQAGAPHPTPYLRMFLSIEQLARMGFTNEAEQYRRAWHMLYPNPRTGNIPPAMLTDFPEVIAMVVDEISYRPYEELGNKCLSQVLPFGVKEQLMTEEAAKRLAAGTDPGIIPERFLIGASRFAFDHRLARPGIITTNFYKELARR